MSYSYITEQERELFYQGKPLPRLYREYLDYLKNVKGLFPGSIHNKKKPVMLFLFHREKKFLTPAGIKKLRPVDVHDYVTNTARSLKRDGKRTLVHGLRDFFRFLHLKGYVESDLSKSVPTITTYRLSTLHRGIPWKQVKAVLKVPNRRTHSGRRDYAILLMLATYGVRAGQVTELRLSDIDWKKQTIYFRAIKHGKDVTAPLTVGMAEALLEYFKGGRKGAPRQYDHVFLTTGVGGSSMCGQRPLGREIWYMIHRRLAKTGFKGLKDLPSGPHSIRHAFATHLLGEKQPIKTISDLLGHKSIHTTFIYAKSDMPQLMQLADEWPEEDAA